MNSRSINLSPYKEISITYRYLHHTLISEATIIIEDGDDYYVIQDDREKIEDVSQMPDYIKQDWIKYNRKELTTQILDWHILDYINKSESQYPNEDLLTIISQLKSIKRNQIIKKII
jgi:hypothetical protein